MQVATGSLFSLFSGQWAERATGALSDLEKNAFREENLYCQWQIHWFIIYPGTNLFIENIYWAPVIGYNIR